MIPLPPIRAWSVALFAGVFLSTLAGCANRVVWVDPSQSRNPLRLFRSFGESDLNDPQQVFDCGLSFEQAGLEECVDQYFAAAVATLDPIGGISHSTDYDGDRSDLHQRALGRLISAGQHFGRLDPRVGLRVVSFGEEVLVPFHHHGFIWDAAEFERLESVGDYTCNATRCLHQTAGIGHRLVIQNCNPHQRPFLPDECHFNATLVLERDAVDASAFSLNLYDPKREELAYVGRPLAKDLSAAYAFRLKDVRTNVLKKFVSDPVSVEGEARLNLLEPYQPGKIPVVFVHGLLSDPFTWMQMVTDLEACPWYVEHFQTVVFRYPTGQAFLASGAELREQLGMARRMLDPQRSDSAFSECVLVGHSMGGLLSKLLVTESSDRLWCAAANQPIDAVRLPPAIRDDLLRAFFFEPSREVGRVVFIGTPHRGSQSATRLIGRVGSLLIELPEENQAAHEQLIDWNPGVFSTEIERRIPTSIDLLDPNSCLLRAVRTLPVNPRVQMHSIIGKSRWSPVQGVSDGVVPFTSAHEPRASSELVVDESHGKLHKHPETRDELLRILAVHLRELANAELLE